MATRRPLHPIKEEGHCLTEEEKNRPKESAVGEPTNEPKRIHNCTRNCKNNCLVKRVFGA
jgi:hypothetical protein